MVLRWTLIAPVLLALAMVPKWALADGWRDIAHSAGVTRVPDQPRRVVALEYRYVEHLVALGLPPVGAADLSGYKRHVGIGSQHLAETRDVGTRQEPNLETIALLQPDLIIGVTFRHGAIYDKLSAIAPTLLFDYTDLKPDGPPQLDAMRGEVAVIADALAKPEAGAAVLARLEDQLNTARRRLSDAGLSGTSVAFGQFLDTSPKVRLFTDHSIAVQLLNEIGLRNAWSGPYERFGYNVAPIEGLVGLRDAHFLHIMYGRGAYDRITSSTLWAALEFVKAGRAHVMRGDTWPFGGPLSAADFVDQTVDLMTSSAERDH